MSNQTAVLQGTRDLLISPTNGANPVLLRT
jgi:hypothetical protein